MLKSTKFKKFILVVLVIALISLVYFEVTVFAPSRLQVASTTVASESIPKDFDGVSIAVFSDIYGDLDKLESAVDKINERTPDLVIFLGNVFGEAGETDQEAIQDSLNSIQAPLGKYAILGSQDDASIQIIADMLEQADFRLVQNRAVEIHNFTEAKIQFLFLDDTSVDFSPADILAGLDDSTFTIAFMNNPDIIAYFTDTNIPLAVAGETLGGKFNIPFFGSIFYRDTHTQSDSMIQGTRLLLSHGIATNNPQIRLFADPNILYITLVASD